MLNVGALRERFLTSPPLFDSVAVLPLTYTGNQDDAYLAGGIQQGLINELALLPGFSKVIAAASTRRFGNSAATLPEIGEVARRTGAGDGIGRAHGRWRAGRRATDRRRR